MSGFMWVDFSLLKTIEKRQFSLVNSHKNKKQCRFPDRNLNGKRLNFSKRLIFVVSDTARLNPSRVLRVFFAASGVKTRIGRSRSTGCSPA